MVVSHPRTSGPSSKQVLLDECAEEQEVGHTDEGGEQVAVFPQAEQGLEDLNRKKERELLSGRSDRRRFFYPCAGNKTQCGDADADGGQSDIRVWKIVTRNREGINVPMMMAR